MVAPASPQSMNGSGPDAAFVERAICSFIMMDGLPFLARCQEHKIGPASFQDYRTRALYEQALENMRQEKPVEVSAIAEELKLKRKLDEVGGIPFLTEISALMPTTAQASYFLQRLRDYTLLRELSSTATRIVEDCRNYSGDNLDEFVDAAEAKMFAITQTRVTDKTQPAAPLVTKAMKIIETMITRKGELTGLPTGYADLDRMTWGLQPSDVIIVAARPSMGKTQLMLGMAENAVLPHKGKGRPGMIFSLEMSGAALMQRMICSRARVNMKLMREGLLSKNGDEALRLQAASDELARAPLFIDDSSSIPVSHIRARARRQHAKTPLAFIAVDYLQLVRPERSETPREQQVSEASRGLKALAKELNVPVIVLSQLNRMSETGNRQPKLSDLRESGSIEQDADVVLLLGRPKDADEKFQVASDTIDVIVAKQRNGPVGDFRLTFERDICRFSNFHR